MDYEELVRKYPPREMDAEAMQADFEFQMAQKMTKRLLKLGAITLCEYDKICALNVAKFRPFMAEILV